MINYFDNQNHSEVFVQYLNELIAEHYGALYHRKKYSPVDANVLRINSVLANIVFACAGGFPYPEQAIIQCGMEAQRQLPPARTIYDQWIKHTSEGIVALYCDFIDRVVDESASKKNPNQFFITCSIAPRVAEIVMRLHREIEECNKAKTSSNATIY